VAQRWVQALTDHDLDAAVECFEDGYADEAPADAENRCRGATPCGETSKDFSPTFLTSPPSCFAVSFTATTCGWGGTCGTRRDGTEMEFVGVNIFEAEGDRFRSGRIYTELVRDAGRIDAQTERMTRGGVMQPNAAEQPRGLIPPRGGRAAHLQTGYGEDAQSTWRTIPQMPTHAACGAGKSA
jgi:hypothetical protein